MTNLSGIAPAVVTPLDAEGRFSEDAFERLAELLYGAGADGLYICGQTGEGMQQSAAQRRRVTEAAVRCSPAGKNVIVHVGSSRQDEAVELARHAAKAGAQAVSSLPPGPGHSYQDVRRFYEALAAASGLPLLIYYFPVFAPCIASIEQLVDLCDIPNVVGLKFTDKDLYQLSLVKQHGAIVFNGSDEVLAAGLLMGADGGIGSIYNLVPELFVEIYALARANRWEQARLLQWRINELIRVLLRFPLYAAIKKVLTWTGIDCGGCVEPRGQLTPAEEEQLRAELSRTAIGETKYAVLAR